MIAAEIHVSEHWIADVFNEMFSSLDLSEVMMSLYSYEFVDERLQRRSIRNVVDTAERLHAKRREGGLDLRHLRWSQLSAYDVRDLPRARRLRRARSPGAAGDESRQALQAKIREDSSGAPVWRAPKNGRRATNARSR